MSEDTLGSIGPTLNGLLNGELQAAHIYMQAGAWCGARSLDGCSTFLLDHSTEELMHMRKFLDYMIDVDLQPSFAALPEPKITVEHVRDLFELILEHERKVTRNIYAAASEAQAIGDQGTFEFLQWFIMEQREEEKTFRELVDRTKLIGDGPHTLYYIDKEVTEIAARLAAASASPAAA
ncbi:ferritin [Amorphus sp. 3PC139-8]|uniref:ferritin n=1 Tax=Amorphus sp. 3PC139-8 TaxID=2735676 RepID=UPI00345CB4A6